MMFVYWDMFMDNPKEIFLFGHAKFDNAMALWAVMLGLPRTTMILNNGMKQNPSSFFIDHY